MTNLNRYEMKYTMPLADRISIQPVFPDDLIIRTNSGESRTRKKYVSKNHHAPLYDVKISVRLRTNARNDPGTYFDPAIRPATEKTITITAKFSHSFPSLLQLLREYVPASFSISRYCAYPLIKQYTDTHMSPNSPK